MNQGRFWEMAQLLPGCVERYQELRRHKSKWRFIIFRLTDSEKEIEVEATGSPQSPHSDFLDYFPADEIRWAVLDVRYKTKQGADRSRVVMITWSPDSLQRETHRETARAKSNAQTHVGALKTACKGVTCFVEAHDFDDLALENLFTRASLRDREEPDPSSVY